MGVFETFVIVSSGNIAFTWVIWKFSRNTTNLTLCHFQSPWRERNHLFKQWLEISLDFQHWDKGKSSTKKIIGTFAQVHRNNVNNIYNEVGNLTEKNKVYSNFQLCLPRLMTFWPYLHRIFFFILEKFGLSIDRTIISLCWDKAWRLKKWGTNSIPLKGLFV